MALTPDIASTTLDFPNRLYISNMHQMERSTDLRFGFLSLRYAEGQGLVEHWKLNATSF